MPAPRHRRSPPSLAWAALAVLAQPQRAAPAADIELETSCQAYAGAPAAYRYCAKLLAESATTVEQMRVRCAATGPLESDCLRDWVSSRLRDGGNWTLKQLIEACGPSDDCRLEVLDNWWDGRIDERVVACDRYGGDYRSDCVIHALQHWAWTGPSAAQITELASLDLGYASDIGTLVAAAIVCGDLPACVGRREVVSACEDMIPDFVNNPRRCSFYRHPER